MNDASTENAELAWLLVVNVTTAGCAAVARTTVTEMSIKLDYNTTAALQIHLSRSDNHHYKT